MHRERSAFALAAVVPGTAAALVAAALLVFPASPAAGRGAAGPITVSVTAGKPTEYRFALSRQSVPLGSVVFRIVNRGKVGHDFSIAGQTTGVLAPGRKGLLTIVFTKAGSYKYSSSVAGQSKKGMQGTFAVKPPAGTAAATTKTTTPAQGGAGSAATGPPCTNPTTSTVSVKLYEFGFTLSQTTIPCGTVTFNVVNIGQIAHNFDVQATGPQGWPALSGGVILLPGEAETHTVTFATTGNFQYQCDRHYDQGVMLGAIKVV